jgi:DinB superfamily
MGDPTKMEDSVLRQQLLELLRGGSAHADLDTCLGQLPPALYGSKPNGAPYSAWELLEHLRLALHDLLVFSTDSHYLAPDWPEDYWPSAEAPGSPEQWQTSVNAIKADLAEFEKLIQNPETNLYAKIPWGDGQTLLREVLIAADHNSYHLGQIVLLRKQLDAWQH